MDHGYDPLLAAQFTALILVKSGGSIEKLKLSKLLYLAERESVRLTGEPMFADWHYSVKDGPICSAALNGIDGRRDVDIWSKYVVLEGNRDVRLAPGLRDEDLTELTDAVFDLCDRLWERFGRMSSSEIRRFTHEELPEYEEVSQGRKVIRNEVLARAVGHASPAAFVRTMRAIRRRGRWQGRDV